MPSAGKVLAYTCHGCHGVPDYKNAFPNYSVPKLGGQNAQYLDQRAERVRRRRPPAPTMHSQAATLSDQDRADIAAYPAEAEVVQPNKQVVGTPPPATQTCVSCHGADGAKTIGPDYPILAGQYPDYIVHALQDYKSGKRKNPIMAGIIAGMDEKDFEAIARVLRPAARRCAAPIELRKHGKCAHPKRLVSRSSFRAFRIHQEGQDRRALRDDRPGRLAAGRRRHPRAVLEHQLQGRARRDRRRQDPAQVPAERRHRPRGRSRELDAMRATSRARRCSSRAAAIPRRSTAVTPSTRASQGDSVDAAAGGPDAFRCDGARHRGLHRRRSRSIAWSRTGRSPRWARSS